MQSLKSFNIYLLTLIILFGSILNVHVHSDQISRAEAETTKEIESSSLKANDFFWQQASLLDHPPLEHDLSHLSLTISHSQNVFTTPQLLDANRIALPPPSFS
jgi:hypothetical protein